MGQNCTSKDQKSAVIISREVNKSISRKNVYGHSPDSRTFFKQFQNWSQVSCLNKGVKNKAHYMNTATMVFTHFGSNILGFVNCKAT